MNARKRLGTWLLYSVSLAPAAIMLGYYWLEYIPSQREYFMNLRFRSLAIMGEQLSIKVERLGSSFKYATSDVETTPSEYISALVPDLTFPAGGCIDSDRPPAETGKAELIKVEFGSPENTVRFSPGKGCPAEASLPQIFTGFTKDELFDDVLLADGSGRVVYQRSATGSRIAALNDLLKIASGAKAAPGEGNGKDADALRTVLLDGSEFALLVQPVRIAALGPGQILQICGLVRSSSIAHEARHVPPEFLLPLCAPLLIVFLSSPFLKTLLLTRTGRLAFHDMALLGFSTAVAAALIALLLVSGRQYWLSERRSTQQLADFAGKLNQQMVTDMRRMRGILDRFDKALPAAIGPQRKDLLAADPSGRLTDELDPFDLVFWANADGCQVAKWTTSLFNFPQVPQISQENFQNVVAGELWSLSPGEPFTLQTVVSQTTSRLIVIMAMPSSHAGATADGCGRKIPSNIVSVALVAQLRSLSWPVVPPGAGFAVFKPDGLVMFHSQSDRNLHENLFEEIRSPEPWREAVAMRAELSDAAYYRGRKFQFHVQPVKGIAGIPWTIATFQEIEPRQAVIGLVWGETLALFGAVLCLIGLVSLLAVVILWARGHAWRQQVDIFLDCLWPGPARRPVLRRLAWQLGAIALLSMAVIAGGSADALSATRWLLPFCLVAPVAAISFAGWRLSRPVPASGDFPPDGEKETAYFVCLSLGLVLLAVVPTIGLWSICEANETQAGLRRWQQDLMKAVMTRRSQMQADVRGSRALSSKAKEFFLSKIEEAGERNEQSYVTAFWQTKIVNAPRPRSGWPADRTAAMPCQRAERGDDMKLSCSSGSGVVEVESTPPHVGFPTNPLWVAIGLALAGCAYAWNCKAFGRLFLLGFRCCRLPRLTHNPRWSPAPFPKHLLVLGLPLAKKDEAVRKWLGYDPPRVSLYTAHFSENWVEKTIALLTGQLTALSAPVARAAAVGETVQSPRAVALKNWVHISNLEAKLGEPDDRQVTADLIEKLVTIDVDGERLRLIVTSVVDPVAHFDSVLSDERKKIYEHPLPEPELQRLAHLLHNFRKVQAPGPDKQRPSWVTNEAAEIVFEECRHQQPLLDVGREVAGSAEPDTPREVLLAVIAERALALYKLYWSSCTRSEKLLLIQLAQTGFVNPLCFETLEELIRKGLILQGRRPRIMNETFRQFLETVEGPDTVHQWESEAGESSWPIIRNILLVLMIVGLAVVGLAQHQAMQTATAALTGVLTVLAGLSRLLGFVTGRGGAAPAESAE